MISRQWPDLARREYAETTWTTREPGRFRPSEDARGPRAPGFFTKGNGEDRCEPATASAIVSQERNHSIFWPAAWPDSMMITATAGAQPLSTDAPIPRITPLGAAKALRYRLLLRPDSGVLVAALRRHPAARPLALESRA